MAQCSGLHPALHALILPFLETALVRAIPGLHRSIETAVPIQSVIRCGFFNRPRMNMGATNPMMAAAHKPIAIAEENR